MIDSMAKSCDLLIFADHSTILTTMDSEVMDEENSDALRTVCNSEICSQNALAS